jgi:lysozyme
VAVRGIDVSHYQGKIDWPRVVGSDVVFCFAKATEGAHVVDSFFKDNWAGCAAAGLTRGAYHFGHPGIDAQTQARHFFATVGALGPKDLPPALDIETLDGQTPEQVLRWVLDFTQAADALFGRQTMIYTDNGFWENLASLPGCKPLGARPLWLAAYVKNPTVPAPWQTWSCWQYSNGTLNGGTPVPGVDGDVDQNWFQPDAFVALTAQQPEAGQGLT